ncbi:hypothetical protein GCM10017673_34350 [Streptosporangium violaceochromogenes]|nr:hypothetical protein GCM10017673_34350 [Streptosporangium violaceochromogenes]
MRGVPWSPLGCAVLRPVFFGGSGGGPGGERLMGPSRRGEGPMRFSAAPPLFLFRGGRLQGWGAGPPFSPGAGADGEGGEGGGQYRLETVRPLKAVAAWALT